jgi:hypothetical protein
LDAQFSSTALWEIVRAFQTWAARAIGVFCGSRMTMTVVRCGRLWRIRARRTDSFLWRTQGPLAPCSDPSGSYLDVDDRVREKGRVLVPSMRPEYVQANASSDSR